MMSIVLVYRCVFDIMEILMTSYTQTNDELVTYTTLANDIHVITFKDASRKAVDAYIEAMATIYDNVTEDDTVRILIDYRETGLPPMRYSIQKSIRWTNSLDIHPTARLALVHGHEPMISLFTTWISSYKFGHLSMQLFEGDTGYTNALDWLAE